MTGIRNSSYQQSEVSNNHGGVRMKFWGVCCVGGKAYKQVVNYRFHLTMAVLDPKSYDQDVRDKTVTLSVIQHGQVFLLCVLKHGQIQQVNLNLIFDKGDDVTFSVGGYGTVHLTGYQLIDSSDCAFDMDNEHYCPVAEMGSAKQTYKRSSPAVNGVQTKHKEKAKSKLSSKAFMGEDEEDEEDSDFSIEPEDIEESEEEDFEDEEKLDEELEEELEAIIQDAETPPKSDGSQKRKAKMSLPEKHIKKGKLDSESDEKGELMSPEENKSDSDEDVLDSSIGHTPMPKQQSSAKAKKKSKKKKKLSDTSMLDKPEKNDGDASQDKMTPKKKGLKHSVIKLEGGVEFQDIIVGRGPIATQGKVVSVFYVGRLENKTIFDARTPPKKPFTFKLGVPEVIRGLDIGIQGMRVGGQRKLRIPPGMGYGSKGVNSVPPNSILFFNVELVSVN